MEKATGRFFAAKFIDLLPGDSDYIKKEIDCYNAVQHPRLAQLHDAFEMQDPTDGLQMVLIYDL